MMHELLASFRALTLFTALACALGCNLGEDLGVPELDGYNYSTSCRSNSDLDACDSCCDGIGGDRALVNRGNCGCGVSDNSTDVCDGTASFAACNTCCQDSGYGSTSAFSSGSSGNICTCFRTAPLGGGTSPLPDGGTAEMGTPVGSGDWPRNVNATGWRFDTEGSAQPMEHGVRRAGGGFEFTYQADDASRYAAAPHSAAYVIANIDVPEAGTYNFAYSVSGNHGDSESSLELRFIGTETVTVADDENVAGAFERSGRVTVTVAAGQRFSIRVGGGTESGGISGEYSVNDFRRL
jgi:hypothetical protein